MRWILLTLVALNVGYLAWHNLADPGEVKPAVPARRPAAGEIVLLEERGQETEKQFEDVVTNPIVQESPPEEPGEKCTAIGPFPDLYAGWQVVDHLAALDIVGEVKAVDQATGHHDFRVLIPPLQSLQEAFRKLRELKARNIDSYVITEGEHALGISLGVFSTGDRAERTRQRLEKDGYEVAVVEIPRFHREYWIYPKETREFALDARVWEELKGSRAGGAEALELRCQ